MPVVLLSDQYEDWLDAQHVSAEEALTMNGPAADDLFAAVELDPKINNARKDEPAIQEPLQPSLL